MIRHRAVQWTGIGAGLAALLAALLLAAALAPQAAAQDGGVPPPPSWFWGRSFDSDNGSMVKAINQDGEEIGSVSISGGQWSLLVSPNDGDSVTLEIQTGNAKRATGSYELVRGKLTEVKPSDFTAVAAAPAETGETIEVQVRARLAPDGRLEFGARRSGGEDVLPSGRFLPTSVVDGRITPQERIRHGRWLRSTEIDLGDGYVVRVIARVNPNDERIEFGLYVDGVDAPIGEYNAGGTPMFLPQGRYFPPTTSHNRWLSSNPPTEVPQAR